VNNHAYTNRYIIISNNIYTRYAIYTIEHTVSVERVLKRRCALW